MKKSVWLVGGDGWAYDIGYGGLDHVLATGATSTSSCSTPRSTPTPAARRRRRRRSAPSAKFAAAGKPVGKKDLGLLANMYGHVYVARVAFGAKMAQTVQAFLEAEAYHGPSLIIAYSHCIAHGYDMAHGAAQQKLAVDSGVWPLYRFDPRAHRQGRAAAAPRLRPAQGEGRRLHAQRVALPHGRARRSRRVTRSSSRSRRRRRERRYVGLPAARRDHACPRSRRRPTARARRADRKEEYMDLSTTYLGMRLPHPLIVGAGPLSDDLGRVKALEDAGAAALVLRSLYEEEITGEQMDDVLQRREPQRLLRRGHQLLARARLWRSGRTSISSICGG